MIESIESKNDGDGLTQSQRSRQNHTESRMVVCI